jgi:hypothetical protein
MSVPQFLRCPSCRQSEQQPESNLDWQQYKTIGDLPLDEFIKCPVCGKYGSLFDWAASVAWPVVLYETELICSCGGEYWPTIRAGQGIKYLCDKCETELKLVPEKYKL